MDSEDSREPAGEVSSDGESAYSSRQNADPRSPDSADGPESPDNDRAASYKSDQNSDVNSPEKFRPPSPDYEPKNGSESDVASPASPSYRPKRSPSTPRKSLSPASNSANPMNDPPAGESPKSGSRSRQNSTTPERDLTRIADRDSRRRNRSDSSISSRDSSPRNRSYANNPPVEEISDGEMESDHDAKSVDESAKDDAKVPNRETAEANLNISHEDLSDVSDLESMGPGSEDDRPAVKNSPIRAPDLSDSRESVSKSDIKLNGNNNGNKVIIKKSPSPINGHTVPDIPKFEKVTHEKTSKTDDVEEQLDFEAEEGECLDTPLTTKINCVENKNEKDDEGSGAASSLEEGEVSDDEERRPEETEPRPVCRFYSRGQCTWGVSCRFLHPGVTDKGNYTMFDMVRSMPVGYSQHHSMSHMHPHAPVSMPNNTLLQTARAAEPPQSESAWERGLRTAKEMLRKATKRKEQDTDFEEKKMHLSLGGAGGRGASMGPGGEEDDADLAAYAGFPPPSSPPPIIKREREEYLRLADRRTNYEEAARLYGARERSARYDRLAPLDVSPPHRGLAYEHEKLDDKSLLSQKARRGRSTREVIVQRAPGARADEWADPWMRGGGSGGLGSGLGGGNRSPSSRRRTVDKTSKSRGRKYSSGSSYSSSSSSRSSSRSSNSSRSGSAKRGARRKAHSPGKLRKAVSPSVIVQERRAATARAVAMNPPAPSARKRVPSPAATRQHAANPPPPHPTKVKTIIDEFGRTKPVKSRQKQRKLYSKTSSSDSSSSSSDSDSESHSSSSSDSSTTRKSKPVPPSRGGLDKSQTSKIPPGTRLLSPKYLTTQKKDIIDNDNRKETAVAKKRAASPTNEAPPLKKPVSRREELLKQLKAVEDAIARKRSKI